MEKKTNEIVEVYNLIKEAKSQKMDSADRFKLVKAMRQLKKIANDYDDFRTDALANLKGETHDEMVKKAQLWQEEGEKTKLSVDERIAINNYFNKYNQDVTDCLKDELEKIHNLDYELLTEDAFIKFVDSNDWTLGQVNIISGLLCVES